jgi:hypothetical protein
MVNARLDEGLVRRCRPAHITLRGDRIEFAA